MTTFIILIIVLLLVVTVFAFVLLEAKKYGTKPAEELVGICNFTSGRDNKRQANLNKILALFNTDSELTNTEIRNELKVSSRTVVRYMDELEKEGKVVQIGKIGYPVTYKSKVSQGWALGNDYFLIRHTRGVLLHFFFMLF